MTSVLDAWHDGSLPYCLDEIRRSKFTFTGGKCSSSGRRDLEWGLSYCSFFTAL